MLITLSTVQKVVFVLTSFSILVGLISNYCNTFSKRIHLIMNNFHVKI